MKRKNIFVDDDDIIEVSLTPLIDTVLVLLIVFILVTPHLEQVLKLYFPLTKTHTSLDKDSFFCIAVNQYGKLFLKNSEEINFKNLIIKVKEYKKISKNPQIVLFADKDLLLHQVSSMIDVFYEIGIENVYIKTKKITF